MFSKPWVPRAAPIITPVTRRQHLPSVNGQDLPPGQVRAHAQGAWTNKSQTGLPPAKSICSFIHSRAGLKLRHCQGQEQPWRSSQSHQAPAEAGGRELGGLGTPQPASVGQGNWPGSQRTEGWEKATGILPVGGGFRQLLGAPGHPGRLGARGTDQVWQQRSHSGLGQSHLGTPVSVGERAGGGESATWRVEWGNGVSGWGQN